MQCGRGKSVQTVAGRAFVPEEHGSEEATVNGGLVHHDRVLLVVATVAGNGHNGIVPCWQLPAAPALVTHCDVFCLLAQVQACLGVQHAP